MSRHAFVLTTVLRLSILAGGLMSLIGPILLPRQFGYSADLSYVGAGLLIGLLLDAALRRGSRPGEQAAESCQQGCNPGRVLKTAAREDDQHFEAPGAGAFRSSLPCAENRAPAAGTGSIQSDAHLPYQPSSADAPADVRPKGLPAEIPAGRRVLIAEDNPINAKLVQCMVQRAGCTALLVDNGRAAVDAVQRSIDGSGPAIDLVLMDVHMPDLDGLAAVREIRSFDQYPGKAAAGRNIPPIIAVTADAFAEDRELCLEAGMDDYLAKPFSWLELHTALTRWLQKPVESSTAPSRTSSAA